MPENNKICDIKDQAVINYIFSLNNRAEFEVVMEEDKPPEPVAPEPIKEIKEEAVKKTVKHKKHKGGR
jgi:hypothetical protein